MVGSGCRTNVSVGHSYIESWLRGVGAAAISNLMEDAVTAEISRSQIRKWVRSGNELIEGERVTQDDVSEVIASVEQEI